MQETLNRCSILIADDDPGDRFLIDKALKDSGVENRLFFMENGRKLLDHLDDHLRNTSGSAPELPCLVLLDLNMPVLDGRETLKIMKGHAELRKIPVVILSCSRDRDDILSSYQEGANSFFTKPLDYSDLVGLMGLLKTYWFQKAQLPI